MFEYERARRKEESVEQSMGPVMCDPRSLIEGLNPQQEEAVKYYGQALVAGLILAGEVVKDLAGYHPTTLPSISSPEM